MTLVVKMKNILFITQNTENELLTHTISCVIMILRFVFVPVKQVKKFGFGEARKKNMRNMVPAFCEKLGHLEWILSGLFLLQKTNTDQYPERRKNKKSEKKGGQKNW